MKRNKGIIITLYTLVIACIGFATVIEKYHGTDYASEHVYGAWWFSALWAMLTVASLAYMMKQRLYKRFALMLLHASFVVILAGALTTHLTAKRGTVRLRTDATEMNYADQYNIVRKLPFRLTLREFRIVNYPGTEAPLDYQSVIQCTMSHEQCTHTVSMNHIANIDGYRLFQQSYDSDGKGVTLGMSYDPYGISITYTGYLLLLLGIIATLLSKKTQMRSLYRKAVTMVLLLFCISTSAVAGDQRPGVSLPAVDEDIAHRMGTIHVLYNDRICPLNTVATDFVMKLTGSASWEGYSADEVFFSWMIYYSAWEKAVSLDDKKPKKAEEKRAIVEMFYNGQFLKIFPYHLSTTEKASVSLSRKERREGESSTGASVAWFSPGAQVLPREIPVKEQFFIKQSMDFLTEAIVTGQRDRAIEIIAKIKLFQREMAGDVLPSEYKTEAEIFYNKLRSIKFPVLVTLQLSLRWWLSGHVPLSNGYETMLFMAWLLLVLTIVLFRKIRIILWIGPLAAVCCLLVAMMTGGGSQISPLMPVLQSPLLSLHVMTVICAYALFALQILMGIYALIISSSAKHALNPKLERITALSQLLLYPAVFLLAIGIFLGAVWANVSWGHYWSWDPKESWALITLMVYAVPLHKTSLGFFSNPRIYHLYMVIAFLAVIITYFGVNFLLGGMHSYA